MKKNIVLSVSGVLITGLLGLSGYLLYSNAQLKEAQIQSELAAQDMKEDISSASSTPEAGFKIGAKPVVQQTVTASTKTSSDTAGTMSTWDAFIDELIVLEGDFFADYTTVDFDTPSQSAVDFQQKTNAQARITLETILRKTAQAKAAFPNKFACLDKEKEAFEKYRIVLDHSDTLLAYTRETNRISESAESFSNKQSIAALRIENSTDRDEVTQLILEALPPLQELGTRLQKAHSIIAFEGTKDYIEWVDTASSYYQKFSQAYAAGEYSNAELDEELVVIQETGIEISSDWAEQLNEWILTHIDIPIATAEKAYTQSENICDAD